VSAQVEWDLKKYLASLGLSRKEAETWVGARQENKPLKVDHSDTLGEHLDRIWTRSSGKANMTTGQIPISRKYELSQRLASRMMITILWAFSVAIWIYVVAYQIANPTSPYWLVASWLPIRMDYFGEIAFMFSFVFAIGWAKLR